MPYMLSSIAESLFWMARYIERAENIARFVEVNMHLSLDLPTFDGAQWEPLVMVTGDRHLFQEKYQNATQEQVVHFLAFDTEYDNSILSSIQRARENARSVRSVISEDMWEQLNTLYLYIRAHAAGRPDDVATHAFFAEVKQRCATFQGITDDTMLRLEGWNWVRLGQAVERADKTSRIVDIKYFLLLPDAAEVGGPFDNQQWGALLNSVGAHQNYRQVYGRVTLSSAVEFLLLNRDFPRSVIFNLTQAQALLRQITGSTPGTFSNTAEQHLGRLCSDFNYKNIQDVIDFGMHEFIDDFQQRLNTVGQEIAHCFFYPQLDGCEAPQLNTQTTT